LKREGKKKQMREKKSVAMTKLTIRKVSYNSPNLYPAGRHHKLDTVAEGRETLLRERNGKILCKQRNTYQKQKIFVKWDAYEQRMLLQCQELILDTELCSCSLLPWDDYEQSMLLQCR
jgi:hypothetical protein